MIRKSEVHPGCEVTYVSHGTKQYGIIKSIPEDNDHTKNCVFVVYHCDGNWGNYEDYTAALTNCDDLRLGWVK